MRIVSYDEIAKRMRKIKLNSKLRLICSWNVSGKRPLKFAGMFGERSGLDTNGGREKGVVTIKPFYITITCLLKYLKILLLKNENFRIKNLIFFLYFCSKNIGCGYTLEPPRGGGSNAYPQSMFLNRNKKNKYTPVNPSFTIKKVVFKGVKII